VPAVVVAPPDAAATRKDDGDDLQRRALQLALAGGDARPAGGRRSPAGEPGIGRRSLIAGMGGVIGLSSLNDPAGEARPPAAPPPAGGRRPDMADPQSLPEAGPVGGGDIVTLTQPGPVLARATVARLRAEAFSASALPAAAQGNLPAGTVADQLRALDRSRIDRAGGVMTGPLVVVPGSLPEHAVNREQLDVAAAEAAAEGAAQAYALPRPLPGLPGSSARALAERLGDAALSVREFGARGDGVADDTAAFRAAAAAAAAAHKALWVPATRGGYLITDTVSVACRAVLGEGAHLDGGNRGAWLKWRPAVVADMKPCLAIDGGMYGGGRVADLAVHGPTDYGVGNLAAHVDPAQLPSYAAFAPGVCAIAVNGSNQPVLERVVTSRVKAGLLLDSTDGHVKSRDCKWHGLFGIYCRRNSEAYVIEGGQVGGAWCNILIGTTPCAGHNGGMHLEARSVHMGFSPYGVYQAVDGAYAGGCLALYGHLDSVRFEQVGEAVFAFLPDSLTDHLLVDSWGFSWSTIYQGWPTPAPGWASNLPATIKPYAEQQQYALRLGRIGRHVRLGWLGDGWPIKRSPHATSPQGVALVQGRIDLGDLGDLGEAAADLVHLGPRGPSASVRRRGGPPARKLDLATDAAVAPAVNLVRNPELAASWANRGSDPSVGLALTTLADPGLAGVPVPVELYEELGGSPVVVRISTSTGQSSHTVGVAAGAPLAVPPGRRVAFTCWAYGVAAVRTRLNCTNQRYLYDSTYNVAGGWTKIVGVDQSPAPEALVEFSVGKATPGGALYLCGLMVSYDDLRPYTPWGVPRVRGGLAVDGAATGTAAPPAGAAGALPAAPAGYLTVKIDGVDRRIAYY
jgi:hypothetical protein